MRLALALLAAAALAAQDQAIRTTVRLVAALTTVTDSRGRYVNGLEESDFLLYDSGRPRPVTADVTYVPISLVIAVQSSSLPAEALNRVRRIGGMFEPLVIGERGEAALFGARVHELRAPFAGEVLYIVATPPVSQGEPLAMIGAISDSEP